VKILMGLIAVVALVAIVAELLAPRMLEARVEALAREHTDGGATVTADAGGFPFLPRLLLDGVVERLTVTLDELDGQEVTIATVALSLDGIHVDRDAMLGGQVEITDIDTGTVLVEVAEDDLSDALGIPVDLDPEMVGLAERALEVTAAGGGAVRVPVPHELLPCDPDMEVAGDLVRLTCVIDEVPGVLARAATG
jgi:hypothetical protein